MITKRFYSPKWKGMTICLSLYPSALVILFFIHLLFPAREGILALSEVLAPYFFLPLALILPFVFLRGTGLLRVLLCICLLLFGVQFPRVFAFMPDSSVSDQKHTITTLSWNMFINNKNNTVVDKILQTYQADIVAFQEVHWDKLSNNQKMLKRYPSQFIHPQERVPADLALFSIYPFREYGSAVPDARGNNRLLWVRLDLGSGRTLVVVNVHTSIPNHIMSSAYSPKKRDEQITAIRAFVTPFLQHNEPVLIIGDMNLTDREPAYKDLANGLRDAHMLVGTGSGHSWGQIMRNQLWPLVRIDYMLSNSPVTPLGLTTDCSLRGSDHCVLTGRFALA
jgi:endonuclease/exonuclease/phosphatase (EEP) superfamily protein YafD